MFHVMSAVSKTSKYWKFQFIAGNLESAQLTLELPESSQAKSKLN